MLRFILSLAFTDKAHCNLDWGGLKSLFVSCQPSWALTSSYLLPLIVLSFFNDKGHWKRLPQPGHPLLAWKWRIYTNVMSLIGWGCMEENS